MKRTTRNTRTVVTRYEVDVEAVASAMLDDDFTRRLIAMWLTEDARSRGERGDGPRG